MGPAIAQALADPLVVEVMVNPDGVLRLDRLGEGRSQTEISLTPGEVERVIRLVASHMRLEVHAGNPIVSAELPQRGGRRSWRAVRRVAAAGIYGAVLFDPQAGVPHLRTLAIMSPIAS